MRTRSVIELGGVAVKILVTPSLYRIAQRRGMDLLHVDEVDPFDSYIKLIYCAAINAWEVDAIDDATMGEFPYKFSDFVDWAWEDKERLMKSISFVYEALTGKPLSAGVSEEVKKKRKPLLRS